MPTGKVGGRLARPGRPGKALAMQLSIMKCYALAWRSFAKWWIPLCLISGALFVFQFLPQLMASAEMNELGGAAKALQMAVNQQNPDKIAEALAQMVNQAYALTHKFATYSLYLFPLVALFTVILLMYANRAVRDTREKRRSWAAVIYIAIVHTAMAAIKMAALVLFIVPGVYLYIKLLFVSLVMLDQNKGPFEAIAISWRMTTGNFWKLLLLMLMNGTLQVLVMPTIIGEIPVTGFANTARAAAFSMLQEAAEPEKVLVSA